MLFILAMTFMLQEAAPLSLDLQAIRASSSAARAPPAPQQPLPLNVLPLCGNGKVDTIKDYEAAAGTLSMMNGAPRVWADEECDDGNRLDFDGCSADCMHMDLWVSGCELQLDQTIPDMEAILSLPGVMLVSAQGGLYALNPQPTFGDSAVRTTLLKTKDFPVTDMFLDRKGRVILYSASPVQLLWAYSFETGALDPLEDLSQRLRPWTSHGYQSAKENWIILHDEHKLLLYNLTLDLATDLCTVQESLGSSWFYIGLFTSGTLLMGDTYENLRLLVSYQGAPACLIDRKSSVLAGNIWLDAFQSFLPSFAFESREYSVVFPDGSNPLPMQPAYLEIYCPIGLWAEYPIYSIRSWFLNHFNAVALSHYIGDVALFQAGINASTIPCSQSSRCVFDLSPEYDPLQANYQVLLNTSWQAVLQNVINNVTRGTGVTNFTALYANTSLYAQVLAGWSAAQSRLASAGMKGFAENPLSKNLWVLRANSIFEIAKSGVLAQLPNGKCLPSGLALCAVCFWASSAEGQCLPCSTASSSPLSLWAWSVQCQGCPVKTLRRRSLLQQQQPNATLVPLEFVAMMVPYAPELSAVPCVNQSTTEWTPLLPSSSEIWNVKVWASDPGACMRALRPVLANMHVLVAPHQTIPIAPSPPQQNTLNGTAAGESGLSTGTVVGIVGGSVGFLLVAVILGVVVLNYHHTKSKPRRKPSPQYRRFA